MANIFHATSCRTIEISGLCDIILNCPRYNFIFFLQIEESYYIKRELFPLPDGDVPSANLFQMFDELCFVR